MVGSGWRFTSGISYYTCRLTNALAAVTPTRAVLMRRLVPTALYPGRARVGTVVNDLEYDPRVQVFDGIDWFWGRTIVQARQFIRRDPPDVLILQWWTGAVLHSYLLLALLARRRGAKVVMEWHEVQDTGRRACRAWCGTCRWRCGGCCGTWMPRRALGLRSGAAAGGVRSRPGDGDGDGPRAVRPRRCHPVGAGLPGTGGSGAPLNILYFGVIRPYKGVEDLVEAFSRLPENVSRQLRLTIVGETWEGWTAPLEAVQLSPVRDRITVVNRYVTDAEVEQFFRAPMPWCCPTGARPPPARCTSP